MRKLFYVLLGCFTMAVVASTFVSCNESKKSDSEPSQEDTPSAGYNLVGTWKQVVDNVGDLGQVTNTMIIKADNKAIFTHECSDWPEKNETRNFSYTYNPTTCVFNAVEANDGPAVQYTGSVTWYGENTVLFTMTPVGTDYTWSVGPLDRQ